jgi:hypothetical protein
MRILMLSVLMSFPAAGCAKHPEPAASGVALGLNAPPQFRFITGNTTVRDVVDKLGTYDKVRGSGMTYYEYDLPDGSAVLIEPEWPFGRESRIRSVDFYRRAGDIDIYP